MTQIFFINTMVSARLALPQLWTVPEEAFLGEYEAGLRFTHNGRRHMVPWANIGLISSDLHIEKAPHGNVSYEAPAKRRGKR